MQTNFLGEDMEEDKYITRGEAANLLGISKGTLSNWKLAKKGPPFYKREDTKRVFYKLSDVEEYKSRNLKLYQP